jgi:hypothetical protein
MTKTLGQLTDADWKKVTTAEKWSVGVTAHHVAGAHESIASIVKTIAAGQPLPHFTMEMLHEGNALGCSFSVLGDYVVIGPPGLANRTALAHEVGHPCSSWHSGTQSNLMSHTAPAGDGAKWFQKNLLCSSRHVQYW